MPLQVDGIPQEAPQLNVQPTPAQCLTEDKGDISLSIKTKDGLHLQKDGLSYHGLKLLVERLEGIC